jgi:hypothetical protein
MRAMTCCLRFRALRRCIIAGLRSVMSGPVYPEYPLPARTFLVQHPVLTFFRGQTFPCSHRADQPPSITYEDPVTIPA